MTAALRRVRGVLYANVDRLKNEAVVVRSRGTASDAQLEYAVHALGYGASVIPVRSLAIEVDMRPENASTRVRAALGLVPGVRRIAVESTSLARVDFDARRATVTRLVEAVRRAGFAQAQAAHHTIASRRTETHTTARPASRNHATTTSSSSSDAR